DYELRAAVMNADTHTASSVFTHITVPSFEDVRLGLSDVVIGTRDNAGALPDGAPAIPIVPTTARIFSASAPAWAFLRVYRPAATHDPSPVNLDVAVLDSSGKRVKYQSQPLRFADQTADVRLALPLKTLAAGHYVLRIDAKQDRIEASRTIAFAV